MALTRAPVCTAAMEGPPVEADAEGRDASVSGSCRPPLPRARYPGRRYRRISIPVWAAAPWLKSRGRPDWFRTAWIDGIRRAGKARERNPWWLVMGWWWWGSGPPTMALHSNLKTGDGREEQGSPGTRLGGR